MYDEIVAQAHQDVLKDIARRRKLGITDEQGSLLKRVKRSRVEGGSAGGRG